MRTAQTMKKKHRGISQAPRFGSIIMKQNSVAVRKQRFMTRGTIRRYRSPPVGAHNRLKMAVPQERMWPELWDVAKSRSRIDRPRIHEFCGPS